ncbi:MAG: CPBP family intramembrane metalloprotease [Deltaproteobacteria bacterium]|nr:CPBP family intramembrane metalloprotease [Deltaproteobacteria bacterium]
MRELIKILVFIISTVLLGCILAPPLYWLGHAVGDSGLWPFLSEFEFHRYFTRAILIAAIVLLWPLLRALQIRRWSDLGLAANPARIRHILLGFLFASLGLGITAAILVVTDRAYMRDAIRYANLPNALLSGVVVAFIEESLFRGALFGALRKSFTWLKALIILSIVFAALHFLKPPDNIQFDTVTWISGFELFPQLFWQYGDPILLFGGFLTLIIFSLVLGFTVVQTKSLYAAMGLHAGWVFALKGFKQFGRLKGEPSIWVGSDLLTGLVPVFLVAATGALMSFYLYKEKRNSISGRNLPRDTP